MPGGASAGTKKGLFRLGSPLALAASLRFLGTMTPCRSHVSFGLLLGGLLLAAPIAAQARDVLGIYERWGAFKEPAQGRCFAMAQPLAGGWEKSPWRPFVAIGYWTKPNVRGQFNIRLSHQLAPATQAVLSVGGQQFRLVGSGADMWAADQNADSAIIAAIRAGKSMSVTGQARAGGRFTDRYQLRGAASAIDAAALGCAPKK